MSSTDPRLLALLDEPVPRALRGAAGSTPCHLVGGVVRDRLLGIVGSDLDAVVATDGEAIGARLAGDLPARLVRLGGKEFAAYRLVGSDFTLDIWDRQEQSLEADLARRDFTVNAFALDVAGRRVEDPFGGRADLEQRRLRATTEGVFADDPLRVLRLVRLSLQLPGFVADPETLELARRSSPGLAEVAVERVRDELGKVLRARKLLPGFELLVDLEVYPGLLSGRPGEAGDASRADRLLHRLEPALEHLAGLPGLPRGRLEPARPRLAALISGLATATGTAEAALERCWRAGYLTSRDAAACHHLLDCSEKPDSQAAARWFLHSWEEDWPAAAAMLAATPRPALPDAEWRQLVDRLIELADRQGAAIFAPPPLLDGNEIGRLLGVRPGPRIGAALALLHRAQVEGRVGDRTQAEALLRSFASDAG